jgi:hypothetical protein
MATELLRPGVSVIQEFRTVSPTIVTPTLVPCAVAPCYQVIEPLELDATGNSVLNTDAIASVPGIITAGNPGTYAGLDGLTLKVSVNNGATQEFEFADAAAAGLSAGQVKDQINAADTAPTGFSPYVVTIGSSTYLQLRTTGSGDGQTLKILDGTANTVFDLPDFYEVEGVSNYQQNKVFVEQGNFPDPRGILPDEADVDEDSIRVFVNTSGINLKEFKRDSTFLRKHKGATYTSGALTFGSFDTNKFAFKLTDGGSTNEFTFATEPADAAALATAMNTLVSSLSGITFEANGTTKIDAKSDSGYFEVVAPSSLSAHASLGWTDGDEAYTLEPVDDGDGDTRTPFITVDQENFNAVADGAVISGTADLSSPVALHNLTLEVALDGGKLQEITFDGGPIVGTNVLSLTNTLDTAVFGFVVNGVAKSVTFTGTNPLAIASVISQINAAAGTTVCYESNSSGVATSGGGYIAWQVGGATKADGGEIYMD